MCRLALYHGPKIRMDALIAKPDHSMIHQSYKSEERDEPLNGDGFGVAWYDKNLSDQPGIFRDISPAWNNQNLINLSRMIQSECILAHVRAATGGLPVTELNCHPFAWRQFSFMHNGVIGGFHPMRRELRNRFSDEVYDSILGSTDSEHAFGLFIDHYIRLTQADKEHFAAMTQALLSTIVDLEQLRHSVGSSEPSLLNFVVSDGCYSIISRFSSDSTKKANSLYLYQEDKNVFGQSFSMKDQSDNEKDVEEKIVLVASEPLTKEKGWSEVESNTILTIDNKRRVSSKIIILN